MHYTDLRHRIKTATPVLRAVEVPEWDVTIYFTSLNYAERVKILEKYKQPAAKVAPDVVIATACDEAGNKLFSEEDREWLELKEGAVLERLFYEGLASSRLLVKQQDEEKNE